MADVVTIVRSKGYAGLDMDMPREMKKKRRKRQQQQPLKEVDEDDVNGRWKTDHVLWAPGCENMVIDSDLWSISLPNILNWVDLG
ncbi:unnamed protein product [Dovyalis caffra]|uniref:Uncharacterized protein n=1 Tax=Dovyalis caffra TaxID=77055 RepID=A0AAV1STA3_9ROSI|nr:unnamed protein product [Dovyalis caffra]